MLTASVIVASAASRSPASACRSARLFSDVGEAGQVSGGAGLGQGAADLDGLGDRGQRGVPVPGLSLLGGQVVQRCGEVGQVVGGAGLGQGAVVS